MTDDMPAEAPEEAPDTRRPVVSRKHHNSHWRLDDALGEVLESADLLGDADTVIACLQMSPLFQQCKRDVAERTLREKRERLRALKAEIEAEEREVARRMREGEL